MKIVRILAVAVFCLCLILNIWATARYHAEFDTQGPELQCPEDTLRLSVYDGEEALLQGLTASDVQDGDLTDKIIIASTSYFLEPGVFTVDYVVFDSHHNSAQASRRVEYTDYESPEFCLSQPLVFIRGQNIRYLNYVTASDVLDGDITDKIKVKASDVSNYTAGTYPVLLEVTNSHGDTVEVELSVVVQDRQSAGPQLQLREYLTYVKAGESFDPYALLLPAYDTDGTPIQSEQVSVLGSVDTEQPGSYQIIYSCQGVSGEGRTYLTVVVTEGEA